MKTASPFSPEALGLGPVEIDEPETPKIPDTTLRAKKQIKLKRLLDFLQSASEKDPEILELPIFVVEFGYLENATRDEIDQLGIVFSS
jgi:hypothetical protein